MFGSHYLAWNKFCYFCRTIVRAFQVFPSFGFFLNASDSAGVVVPSAASIAADGNSGITFSAGSTKKYVTATSVLLLLVLNRESV